MRFDMAMENRKLLRQAWAIVFSAVGLVVGAFAAGAAWMHYPLIHGWTAQVLGLSE